MKKGILILLAAFFAAGAFGLGAHAEGGVAKIGDVEYEIASGCSWCGRRRCNNYYDCWQYKRLHFEKGSIITIANGTITTDSTSSSMLFQNYAELTLTDVIVDATNIKAVHTH